MTCTNVTSSEDWTCSNFFGATGTRALAKSEISRGTGPPTTETATWDVLFFNVTYAQTTPAPTISYVDIIPDDTETTDDLNCSFLVTDPDNATLVWN